MGLNTKTDYLMAWKLSYPGKLMKHFGGGKKDLVRFQLGTSALSLFSGAWILHRLYPQTAITLLGIILALGKWLGIFRATTNGMGMSVFGGFLACVGVASSILLPPLAPGAGALAIAGQQHQVFHSRPL